MPAFIFSCLAFILGLSGLIHADDKPLPPTMTDKHGIEFILLQAGVYSTPGLTTPERV